MQGGRPVAYRLRRDTRQGLAVAELDFSMKRFALFSTAPARIRCSRFHVAGDAEADVGVGAPGLGVNARVVARH